MKIDSPKSIFNPACAEKISIFSAHAGCALPDVSGSIRTSPPSGQDIKPPLQAGRPAAYTPPGWFIRSAGRILFGVVSLGGCGGWGLAGLNIIKAGVVIYANENRACL